jgi:hypothetical protein
MLEVEPALIVSFGDNQYYVPAKSFELKKRSVIFEKDVLKAESGCAFIPATVFHFEDLDDVNCSSLDERVTEYLETDDVFSTLFLKAVLISVHNDPQGVPQLEEKSEELLKTWGTSCVILISTLEHPLPGGPYFILNAGLRQAWRCYPDPVEAFTTGTVPSATENDLYVCSFNICNLSSDHIVILDLITAIPRVIGKSITRMLTLLYIKV